jgi:hypothetical protein
MRFVFASIAVALVSDVGRTCEAFVPHSMVTSSTATTGHHRVESSSSTIRMADGDDDDGVLNRYSR